MSEASMAETPTPTRHFHVAGVPGNLRAAHVHSVRNALEIGRSLQCGCFQCLSIFPASEVKDWGVEWTMDVRDGFEIEEIPESLRTAQCPHCCIDAVIGDAAGFPITPEFLQSMKSYWF